MENTWSLVWKGDKVNVYNYYVYVYINYATSHILSWCSNKDVFLFKWLSVILYWNSARINMSRTPFVDFFINHMCNICIVYSANRKDNKYIQQYDNSKCHQVSGTNSQNNLSDQLLCISGCSLRRRKQPLPSEIYNITDFISNFKKPIFNTNCRRKSQEILRKVEDKPKYQDLWKCNIRK